MTTPTLRFTDRLGAALQVLRGNDEATRAVIPLVYPNFPGATDLVGTGTGTAGVPQMALVRTANPQEYKPDGASIRVQGFTGHPIVHACIRAVADIVASIPFVVLRERGNYETRVGPDHPLQRLVDYPGPRFTARAMRAKLAVDYLGYGNAFLQMQRGSNGQGVPRQLAPINPESLQTVWVDASGDPRRYDYGNWAGIIVHVDAADIIHIRDLDMPRPFAPDVFGFPRGATALGSIAADNEATRYVRQVVTNDGTPTFAVLMTDEATQDDASAMQDRYKARTVDRGKRGTPAFFGGVRDVKPLGFTLSDLEFPDLRRVSREDICAAFGVDPRMIGVASASNDGGLSGSQYVEARARLVQHTIEPMLSAIEDELNHWLSPEFGEAYVCYDADVLRDLVENDEQTSTRVRAEFAASLRTWEESRRALKLSPLPVPTDTLALTPGAQLVPAATAVIDPSAVMALPPEPVATGGAEGGVTGEGRHQIRAALARAEGMAGMSGDQIEAVMELLESVIEGEMPREAVEALIGAAFPSLKPAVVAAMLDAVEDFEPEEEEEDAGEDLLAPMDGEEDGEDGEDGEDDGMEAVAPLAPYRAALTNFPKQGDDKKVSLRNSNYGLFPVAEAEQLKREYPAIWRKGGNIRGNRQFAALAPIAKAGGAADTPAEERAVKLREAWAARHYKDFRIAGVIAQVKWLVVGEQGLSGMRKVIAEAKAKDRRQRAVATMPAPELPSEVAPLPLEDAQGRPWWVHHPEVLDKTPARQDDQNDLRFRYWKRTMDELDRREREFYTPAKALFASQKRSVARLFAEATNRAADPILDEIERRIRADYAPGGDYHAAWREAYLKLIEETYLFGARQVAGVGFSFGSRPPEVMQAISNRATRLADLIGQDTARQVTAAIRAGEMGGLSMAEISRLIQASVYGERMTDVRATRIARTESAGAVGQGSWDQAQAMDGLFQSKEWLAFEDGKTRPTHTACMGEGRMAIDQPFAANGLMYPHDPAGDASEVVNCRCTLAYFADEAPAR